MADSHVLVEFIKPTPRAPKRRAMACIFRRGEFFCLYSRHFGSVVADRIFGACSGRKRKCDGLRPSCATNVISLANMLQ